MTAADNLLPATRPLVLIVEDDAALMTVLRYNLERQGFRIEEAVDGKEGLARIAELCPNLVLLDWGLPLMSGLDVCRQIRRRSAMRTVPVIMLTARTDSQDAVRGLDAGADDYIVKPFDLAMLIARMRSLLRRAGSLAEKPTLNFLDLTLDVAARRVLRNGRPVHLGPTEFRLLEFFIQHPKRVFTRNEILNAVWGMSVHVEDRTVDVHIGRLRRAINGVGERDLVRTVRAAGYALDSDSA
jgi:two-component system, OmpR family, phosphate regulon response regulator PhoB